MIKDPAIHLLLIDSLNLIRRVHAAVPGEGEQAVSTALEASATTVGRLLSRFAPTHGVCAFDGPAKSWRHRAYPAYKAGRKPMPDALREGLERFYELFRYKGLTSLAYPDLEADDLMATLAAKTLERGGRVTLVSTDKGFAQLLALETERLTLWDPFNRVQVTPALIEQRFGVLPAQLCDFLALCGDSTNHIRGVDGIGAKTAARLLQAYTSLEGVYQNLAELPEKQCQRLRDQRHQAELAARLVRLQTDLTLDCRLRDFRLGEAMSLPRTQQRAPLGT